MRELVNLKPFDEYINILNEDLVHGEQSVLNRAFVNGGPIDVGNGETVTPQEIVAAVNAAIMELTAHFPTTFEFAKKTLNIIYLAHSNKIKTMAVDAHMNLYMNAGFIYHTLKMDKELIGAVIMHEVFHALYNHIERGTNWLAAQGKPKSPQNWHDTNLAADMEVNRTLVRTGFITAERLVKEIKGIYLDKKDGNYDVVPMEVILGNEDYMKKLREMCPPDPDPSKQPDQPEKEIKTTEEWNHGYKDAWNKIAGLIKKYGHKGAWQKLMDAGIVNAVGEIYKDKDIEDIMGLEFLTVKSMEEFIKESLDVSPDDKGQTYDDGFMNAFGKLVNKLYSAVNPSEDSLDGPSGPSGGPKLKSDMKDDELDPIEFPPQKGKKQKGEGGDDVPENTIQPSGNNDDENEDGEKKQKQQGQGGGQGKSDEDLTDDDINKLADDIEKRTNGGQDKISTTQDIEYGGIGGTGSFQEDGLSDDDLKDAGYSQEDIDKINEVRESNKTNNSKANIKKHIDSVRRNLRNGDFIKKTLQAIEIEENKYKNLWRDILENFMSKSTRRAGRDLPNGANDWINKKAISRGEYGIHRKKLAQDPQDVNIYVDVSGSMDLALLEIICKSLVVFSKQWKYSGINICPWASTSNGVHKVEDFYKKTEGDVTKEILEIVSTGQAQCGGGTDADAAITAMVDVVVETLSNPEKKKKDDIHVVITDGYFDLEDVENRMSRAIRSEIDRDDVAEKAPENTIWMIYDSDEEWKKRWNDEIKKGKIIFISSKIVKNNG